MVERERMVLSLRLHWFHFSAVQNHTYTHTHRYEYVPSQNHTDTQMHTHTAEGGRTSKANNGILLPYNVTRPLLTGMAPRQIKTAGRL